MSKAQAGRGQAVTRRARLVAALMALWLAYVALACLAV